MTKDSFKKALATALGKHNLTNKMSDDEIEEAADEVTETLEDELGDEFIEAFDSESIDDEDVEDEFEEDDS